MKASSPSVSPRADGSMPAWRSATSAAAADPAHPASAARNVLRRWANAASITVNTSVRLRPSPSAGGSRRTSRSRLESTFGTGQKTLRLIEPARLASAYQASFTLGTP